MAFVATENFRTVNEILKDPPQPAGQMIHRLGDESARMLLRYQAGEENRLFFQNWEIAELVLGLGLSASLYLGRKRRLLLGMVAAIVLLTTFQHFRITPDMLWQGRAIDFVPVTAESAARQHFGKLHAAYGVIESVKVLMLMLIGGLLLPRWRRARQHVQVDAVNYADHGHVDG